MHAKCARKASRRALQCATSSTHPVASCSLPSSSSGRLSPSKIAKVGRETDEEAAALAGGKEEYESEQASNRHKCATVLQKSSMVPSSTCYCCRYSCCSRLLRLSPKRLKVLRLASHPVLCVRACEPDCKYCNDELLPRHFSLSKGYSTHTQIRAHNT